jgi:hypothetical protein
MTQIDHIGGFEMKRSRFLLISLAVLCVAAPAFAYSTYSIAYWNDQRIAIAWFNSGTTDMSKGRNSFTLKVEDGASVAALWYQVDGEPQQTKTISGSGNEVSFSVSGPQNPPKSISYGVCGEYWGHRECGPFIDDIVR